MNLTALPADLTFWDQFAPYYERWATETGYHRPIIRELASMVEPGWKVLDIGAATGVLSIPLASLGCHVTALEPSEGMRGILQKKVKQLHITGIESVPLRWEDYQTEERFDLVLASNTLHLYESGFLEATKKAFSLNASYFCLVTEIEVFPLDFKQVDTLADGYEFIYIKTYQSPSHLCPGTENFILQLITQYHSDLSVVTGEQTRLSILWWERL